MRIELLVRCGGGLLLASVVLLRDDTLTLTVPPEALRWTLGLALVAFAVGFVITPYVTLRPLRRAYELARRLPAKDLVAATLGLLIGLVIAVLAAIPLSLLPALLGKTLPFVFAVAMAYLGVAVFLARRDDIFEFIQHFPGGGDRHPGQILVDTSAIIDGRIADICQTGFLTGPLLIPRFVLNELQRIADSADPIRRNRGRRGLDILHRLRREIHVPVRIVESDGEGTESVDARLVRLARQYGCPILTLDYNLNKVAALQGVRVLNINELANAVKTVVLPGEELTVRVIQDGKEAGQGVGYLDDGTMVVVEGGRRHLNCDVDVVVTRVLQTAAGRLVFAQPRSEGEQERWSARSS